MAAERLELSRGHAEALMPMVDRVCRAAETPPGAFDRLAVTIGPGHFTSLRVGLAAARGLALASGRPLIGVTTLDAVAAAVPADRRTGAIVMVALDSKRAEAYVQSFDATLAPLDRPAARIPAEYGAELAARQIRIVAAGDAAERVAEEARRRGAAIDVIAAIRHPDAAVVAALAASAALPAAAPAPLYIHPVQTTSPSKAAFGVSS